MRQAKCRLGADPFRIWVRAKISHRQEGAAGSLWFHLPRFHFGYLFFTHRHLRLSELEAMKLSPCRAASRMVWTKELATWVAFFHFKKAYKRRPPTFLTMLSIRISNPQVESRDFPHQKQLRISTLLVF